MAYKLNKTDEPNTTLINQPASLKSYDDGQKAVLCAIAYHQPLSRDGLKDIFGKDINRDLINRLRFKGLIGNGPKSPRKGAPHTYMTTPEFLALFDMQSLRDLPELDLAPDSPTIIQV